MVWTPLQKQKQTARAPEASRGGQGSPKGADQPGREGQCGLNREGEHREGSGGTRRSPRQSSTSGWRAWSEMNGSTSHPMTKCTEHQSRQRRRKGQMFSEDSVCLHQLWRLKFSPGSAPSQPSLPIHLLHRVLLRWSAVAPTLPTPHPVLPSCCSSSGDLLREVICSCSSESTSTSPWALHRRWNRSYWSQICQTRPQLQRRKKKIRLHLRNHTVVRKSFLWLPNASMKCCYATTRSSSWVCKRLVMSYHSLNCRSCMLQ